VEQTTRIVIRTRSKIALYIEGQLFGNYDVPEDSDLERLAQIISNPDWTEDDVNTEINRLWTEREADIYEEYR
jgi:hypothetical protein